MARSKMPIRVEESDTPVPGPVTLRSAGFSRQAKPSPTISGKRLALVYVVAVVLLGVVYKEGLVPARSRLSERYLERGDTRLTALQYDAAATEYRRSVALNSGNTAAKEHLKLAEAAPTDIAVLRGFLAAQGAKDAVAKIDSALQQYPTAKKAVEAGVAFISTHDYAYARYPLEQAVAMDPHYPEAWDRLAAVYTELAKENASYTAKAREAETTRNKLTTRYLDFQRGGGR